MRLLDRLFRLEEINGHNICPTYLYRWTLLSTPWFKVYLHHFVGDDWSLDLHDHPKRFISIGLKGGYVEETPGQELTGEWEVHMDSDRAMARVRWSVPGEGGAHLYVRHYPGSGWGINACEQQAAEFNRDCRTPYEWGSAYRPAAVTTTERRFRAPWIRTFPAEHIHRVRLDPGQDCWTLVIVLKTVRAWGFWHAGTWVHWRDYVGSDTASKMKSCGD